MKQSVFTGEQGDEEEAGKRMINTLTKLMTKSTQISG